MPDAVVGADPVEHHRARSAAEPGREHLPVDSVRICSGIPYRASAPASAWHTGRDVAAATTFAQTMNREWSSMPVTTFTSTPLAR